ncbi:hypothetical protein C8Q80DRAFT_428126 [Daedaleopsis nitida]|nr:hypothetical protein C8Q80DRAFT_428126 [Daedaleopsis nitida]
MFMWLLSTDRAELEYFVSAEKAAEAEYAILCHIWNKTEQSFQETEALRAKCAAGGTNPRDFSSDKVRESCKLAERHGYKWIWNDTCCLDKTSSSELSEAINSMFSYYSLAAICYAYLQDVEASNAESQWKRSRWFTRGWTLQELIAPNHVLLLYQDWTPKGMKADLAEALEDLTCIPAGILQMTEELSNYSVGERMEWAAKRETTRREDEAYCLMGIFDINMPTLYGEGSKAFRRLQEEIMKHTFDPTLVAWGPRSGHGKSGFPTYCSHDGTVSKAYIPEMYLFAPSPASFTRYPAKRALYDPNIQRLLPNIPDEPLRDLNSASPSLLNERQPQAANVPAFTITPHGVRARLPVVQTKHGVAFAALFVRHDWAYSVLLVSSATSHGREVTRPVRLITEGATGLEYYLKSLGETFTWRDIYIHHRCTSSHSHHTRTPHQLRPYHAFPPSMAEFPSAARLEVSPLGLATVIFPCVLERLPSGEAGYADG